MISKALVKYVRISPRKVRYVLDVIRDKSVEQARGILNGAPRRAGEIVRQLLDQAADAAEKNSQVAASELKVSKTMADGGPTMKRFRAASMGRASVIRKRTAHIYIELDLIKKSLVPLDAPKVNKKTAQPRPITLAPKALKKEAGKTSRKKEVGAR